MDIPHTAGFQAANHRRAFTHYPAWWDSDGFQLVWADLCGTGDPGSHHFGNGLLRVIESIPLVLTVFAKSGRAMNSFRRCRSPGAATCNYGNFLNLPEIHQAKRVETFLVN